MNSVYIRHEMFRARKRKSLGNLVQYRLPGLHDDFAIQDVETDFHVVFEKNATIQTASVAAKPTGEQMGKPVKKNATIQTASVAAKPTGKQMGKHIKLDSTVRFGC
jgi:hypothetical protein